jgi:Zn-dependent peptidase ImmA (M78 family)
MNQLDAAAMFRAHETRNKLGLSAFEPIDIVKVLQEDEDVSFIYRPFESGISGMFLRLGSTQVIVINTSRTLGHQRFTVAHEYCHLSYDRGMTGRVCVAAKYQQDVRQEQEADRFAANLLMPAEAIAIRIVKRTQNKRELSIDDVVALEQHFGVSHAAMLIRLRELNHISDNQYHKLKSIPITQTAKVLGYSPNLYLPTNETNLVSSYAEKAKRALETGRISEGRYRQLLLEAGLADLLYGEEATVIETI